MAGTAKLMKDNSIDTKEMEASARRLYEEGKTLAFVAIDGFFRSYCFGRYAQREF
jgi:hypothetical protein